MRMITFHQDCDCDCWVPAYVLKRRESFFDDGFRLLAPLAVALTLAFLTGVCPAEAFAQTKLPSPYRRWTDRTGKYKTFATFRGIEGDVVRLEKDDRRVIEVPLERLSAADQAAAWMMQREDLAPAKTRRNDDSRVQSSGPIEPTKEVDGLIQAFSAADPAGLRSALAIVEKGLFDTSAEAPQIARDLLNRAGNFFAAPEIDHLLLEIDNKHGSVLAARLALQIVQARSTVRVLQRGDVVVGQVQLPAKADPNTVLAQAPLLPRGYFATAVGDLNRPLLFRATGFRDLEIPLKPSADKQSQILRLEPAAMTPVGALETGELRGKVVLDGGASPSTTTVRVSLQMIPVNTPDGRLGSPMRPPETILATVSRTGEFSVPGLSPSDYQLQFSADKHVPLRLSKKLSSGTLDLGDCRLFSSDLSIYLGRQAPSAGKLVWETDYQRALARARSERKPMLIMMTATWCGYCKLLERDTLDEPWMRHFLQSFVLVKAFEDKEVERIYGAGGYPTLVFANSDGQVALKSVGYKPVLPFCEEYRKALTTLQIELPPEIQTLADKQLLARPAG